MKFVFAGLALNCTPLETAYKDAQSTGFNSYRDKEEHDSEVIQCATIACYNKVKDLANASPMYSVEMWRHKTVIVLRSDIQEKDYADFVVFCEMLDRMP